MRGKIGTSVASLMIVGAAIAGVTSTANAETARKVSSAANAQYQARYDYAPATQPQVVQPQAAQPQTDTASTGTTDDRDIYFYHAMGTMSHP